MPQGQGHKGKQQVDGSAGEGRVERGCANAVAEEHREDKGGRALEQRPKGEKKKGGKGKGDVRDQGCNFGQV
eukprot:CAMPEP_0174385776 /NCGR_PEP_ID=MMETSP0811_2-20130205/126836_1 /TAXON_ID=73025 ORGANISM="Eutreptiella gymnastica-like, Strain CCMP1594" /NCGR_SAMPLE_ID=MMETSP0811_2 /ASSEMBLY_ACC=CAM_ASM_000667 /LENGTH=71 /DNA_ID=CAMNT_0015540225 /DNA_START=1568 /DNA_END=1783 /DNA_ORIENTATION=-